MAVTESAVSFERLSGTEISADAPIDTSEYKVAVDFITPILEGLKFLTIDDFWRLYDPSATEVITAADPKKAKARLHFSAAVISERHNPHFAKREYSLAADKGELLALIRVVVYMLSAKKIAYQDIDKVRKFLDKILDHSEFNKYINVNKDLNLIKSTMLYVDLLYLLSQKDQNAQLVLLTAMVETYQEKLINLFDNEDEKSLGQRFIICELLISLKEVSQKFTPHDQEESEYQSNIISMTQINTFKADLLRRLNVESTKDKKSKDLTQEKPAVVSAVPQQPTIHHAYQSSASVDKIKSKQEIQKPKQTTMKPVTMQYPTLASSPIALDPRNLGSAQTTSETLVSLAQEPLFANLTPQSSPYFVSSRKITSPPKQK